MVARIIGAVIAILVLLLVLVATVVYMTIQIFLRIGGRDKLIAALPISIFLVLVMRLIYYAAFIHAVMADLSYTFNNKCLDTTFALLPNFMFPASSLINLFIWINFVLGT